MLIIHSPEKKSKIPMVWQFTFTSPFWINDVYLACDIRNNILVKIPYRMNHPFELYKANWLFVYYFWISIRRDSTMKNRGQKTEQYVSFIVNIR